MSQRARMCLLVATTWLASAAAGCQFASSVDRKQIGATTSGATCDPASCPGADGDCRTRMCDAQAACAFDDEPAATACDEDGGSLCDGDGSCLQCLQATDCTDPLAPACEGGVCVPGP